MTFAESRIDFQPYLKAIARLYSQQNALYTPTDALLPLEARSVEPQDTQQPDQERQVEQFPVLTGLRKYALGEQREHLLLAGRPGSGKSTALKQLAVALAEEGQVPVLVQLKGDRTVPELIQAEFRRAKQRVTLEQIEDWLLADRLILLLDGVNEIPNDDLRRGLAQFREDNPTVPMIFTTRELAVGGDLGIGKRLEMKPLSEPQMREFVKKYLPEHGEQLLTQLRDRLREIAETPLFLKMLCDVFKQTREIPKNKGELFQQFDRSYERLKKDYAPVSKNFWEFKSEVLQHLAFSMIQADGQKPTDLWLTISKKRAESLLENWLNQRGVVDAPTKAKEWLKDLCNHHLLQDAAKPGEIEFHHQLFQEYYAAEYLLQILPSLSDEQLKRDYLNYLKWTEAIALMLSLLDESQALLVVRSALDVDRMLGARFAGEVQPKYQKKTVNLIHQLIIDQDLPEWLKIELFGRTRSEISHSFLFQALSNQDINIVQAAAKFLGETTNQEAISSLSKKLETIDAQFFAQTEFGGSDRTGETWTKYIEALAYIAPQKAIHFLRSKLSTEGGFSFIIDLVTDASSLLMKLDCERISSELISQLKSAQEEYQKTQILNLLGATRDFNSIISDLIQILEKEKNESIQVIIIKFLGRSNTEIAIKTLTKLISEPNQKLRQEACNQLIKCKIKDTRELENLLNHENWDITWAAAEVLGNLGYEIALPLISNALQHHEQVRVRITAANILGKINSSTSVSFLLQTLCDDNPYVRREAAFSLSNFGQREAISELMLALKSGYPDIRRNGIRGLARLKVEEPLWSILHEKTSGWQAAAVELIKLDRLKALPYLCQALIDLGSESSNEVIDLLSKFVNCETLDWLLNAIESPEQYPSDPYFCNRIALVLLEYHPDIVGSKLSNLSDLLTRNHIQQLFWVIPTIQSRCKYYNHEIAHGLIPQGRAIALYFSYAAKDEDLRDELEKHLSSLKREGVITSWDSRQILPGDERERVINQQLNTADIILLLISPDSMADDNCYDIEIKRAMERHEAGEARVIPILLRPVDWKGALFSSLTVLPKNGKPVMTPGENRDEAFEEIAKEIRAVAIELRRAKG